MSGRVAPRLSVRAGEFVLLLGCMIGAWQALHSIAGDVALSAPLATLVHALGLLGEADFWVDVAATFRAFVMAFVISAGCGLALGLGLGLNRLLGEVTEPVLVALYTVPKVAFYPVILLFCGIGYWAEVVFGAIHGIIPIMMFTMGAVGNIRPVLLRTARALGLTRRQLLATVVVPAALPEIFTGLRVGFSVTLIGTLLSEMFGSRQGIGYLLMNAIGQNAVLLIMSVTLLIVVFAVCSNALLLLIEARLHRRG